MLFYYTGTGNCLYVSRKLEKNIFSIPQELKKDDLSYEDDTIGIVAPIYAGELPKTVRRFIEKAHFKTDYFYMILTYGNRDSVAGVWSEKFCKEHGIKVDYIKTVKMVDNYLPGFDMLEQTSMEKNVDEQLEIIIEDLKQRKRFITQPTEEGKAAYEMVCKRFAEHPELNNGETIIMTDRCTGCGICQKVCPIGNITLENAKAKRINNKCDFCLGCVQNCPFKAIDLIVDKNPNERYRHPEVTLKDIIQSNQQ